MLLLDSDSLTNVVHALVTSKLDYCSALYGMLPLRLTPEAAQFGGSPAHRISLSHYTAVERIENHIAGFFGFFSQAVYKIYERNKQKPI